VSILFVANFPAGTGYAWHTIEQVFCGLAERAAQRNGGTPALIAYPKLGAAGERSLSDSSVVRVEFDYARTAGSLRASLGFAALLRRNRVRLLYLTDQTTWSLRYVLFRLAGVRAIVVHDRTSGERQARSGLAAAFKRMLHRVPWLGATVAVGVSEFVGRRLVEVNGVAAARVRVVYNGIAVERFRSAVPGALARLLALPEATPIIFLSGRAQPYKGIEVAMEAAARLAESGNATAHFVYCGDGPALAAFRDHARRLELSQFHFLGRRDDVPDLLGSATIAVVPSVWGEAFGLTVVEAMAAGVPVIASAVGGIPELLENGRTGMLVPPGDSRSLADAIRSLLDDPARRESMGEAGRDLAQRRFRISRVVDELDLMLIDATDGIATAH